MKVTDPQYDYPVKIDESHRAVESHHYSRDRFDCANTSAYIHTGGWPAFAYCPFCGQELEATDE